MQIFQRKDFIFKLIIWVQIFALAGAPLSQSILLADSYGVVSESNAGQRDSKKFFKDYFGQRFILNHPPKSGLGFFKGVAASSTRFGKKFVNTYLNILRSSSVLARALPKNFELATTETEVDFETQPIETLVPLGINLKGAAELKVETYKAEDGKQKPRLRFENSSSPYNNSRYEFTLPEYDIIAFTETENLAMFLNRDGTIYGVDKTNPSRNFGRGYVGLFPISKVEISSDANYELRFNLGPFSRGGLPFSREINNALEKDENAKITLGSLLVVRKWHETQEGENSEEISAIVSDTDQLKGLVLPTLAIAVAAEREKPDVAISLSGLNDEYQAYIKQHDDFFGTAKAEETIGKIRALEGQYISQAYTSLDRQLSMLDESRNFSLAAWIESENLQLTSTSKEILGTIFSNGLRHVRVLETTVKEFQTELSRQINEVPLAEPLKEFFGACVSILNSSADINEKLIQIKALSLKNDIVWNQWLNAEATRVSEPAEYVLSAALNQEETELWNPTDKIVVAALYELGLKLEVFLRQNALHPQAKEIKAIIEALEGLKRTGSSEKLKKLTTELRRVSDDAEKLSLIDLIAAASVDENTAFANFATATKLVHPKNIPFFQKVKNSKLVKHLKKAQEAVFNGPNLLMAAGFAYIYLGKQFSPEYKGHLSQAWLYHFGLLQLIIGGFWAYGKFKAKQKDNIAAVGMSSLGIPLYGGLLSIPTGIMWARLSEQDNFTYAVTHGVFPTSENGGLLDKEAMPEEAREKILSIVHEKEAKLATLRLEAFRAVATINNITLVSQNWSEMQTEWQQAHIARFKAEDKNLDEQLKEAELTGDPEKIATTEANIKLAKFRRALEFGEFQTGVQNAVALVTNQLDTDYRYKFASGLSTSKQSAIQEAAKKFAVDTKEKSSLSLKVDSTVYGARSFFRNNFAKILSWPLSAYRAAQQAVIRPEIARVVYSNWRTDMVMQYLIDGAWNGYPLSGVLKDRFNYDLPTRANPYDPDELFAQPGKFLHTHGAETGNLFQQHFIYSVASTTRSQSELGKPGSSIKNPFADSFVPDAEKHEPFLKSLKRFMQNAFKGRKIGAARYLDQNFKNTFRYAQPAFLIEAFTTGVIAGFPAHKIVAQYIFFRGLGTWAFGWPWLPLNLGMAYISEEVGELRKAFVTTKMKFLEAVEAEEWLEARLRLVSLKQLFDKNEEKFVPLEKLGARTVDSLTADEIKEIASYLQTEKLPFFADTSHTLNDVTSFVGGVTTTMLGVPFFVLKASFPLAPWLQSLIGVGGLLMFPAVVAGIGAYDKFMKGSYDQRKIVKEGEKEADRLSDPVNFAYEVSARLLARQIAEEKKLKAAAITDEERTQQATAITEKYAAARVRLEATLAVLKEKKAHDDAGNGPGSTGSRDQCINAMMWMR